MTVASIRTTYLNGHLGRNDGAALPWGDGACDQYIADAIAQTWPMIGLRATGTVSTDDSSDVYAIPSPVELVSKIDVIYASGGKSGRVGQATHWQYVTDTTVRIEPLLSTNAGLTLLFIGWAPFNVDASDLPARLERAIAARAASLAFGDLGGQLANSERQQGLDRGQVVDYPTAVGLAAYWERRYFEQIERDPARVSFAPVRGRR